MGITDFFGKFLNPESGETIKTEVTDQFDLSEKSLTERSKDSSREKNMSNPLLNLSETELRDLCRHYIDTFESWSRRLLDETFKTDYGPEYINCMVSDGQPLINNDRKKRIEQRVNEDPTRYPRIIDAILIDDVEYFLCRGDLYPKHFKSILEPFYTTKEDVRNVLERIIPIRNKLSHNNTISIHEAEQCICYTNDFVDVFKQHFIRLGKEKDFNVPTFLRIKDSLGNDIIRQDSNEIWRVNFYGNSAPKIHLRSGDYYKLWVEVDRSFNSSFYEIKWVITQDISEEIKRGVGNTIEFSLNNKNVSLSPSISLFLTTKRDWHRFRDIDDILVLEYDTVLPPIEDTY